MSVRRHMVPLLMALPVHAVDPRLPLCPQALHSNVSPQTVSQTVSRTVSPQTASPQAVQALYYLPHSPRRPALPATLSRSGKLVVRKYSPCHHKLATCPVCHPAEYMQRRVVKAVSSALKRLGLQKTEPMLTYLGADTWQQVLHLLDAKREAWNSLYPDTPMTPTNTALDHIRPVHAFSDDGRGAQALLCNHYTNLQPMLHEDNAWKGDNWSTEDERVWHESIILKPDYTGVYYPRAAPAQPSLLFARPLEK